jgi:hypothetical protein
LERSRRLEISYLRSSTYPPASLSAAIDHDASPRDMLGADVSMLTSGIIGLLTMPRKESYSISKNNVHGRAV